MNKAKGVKNYVAKNLTFEEYSSCLLDREKRLIKNQHLFRNRLHEIYTESINKTALNGDDDKRFICEDGIRTLAWGHYKIINNDVDDFDDDYDDND